MDWQKVYDSLMEEFKKKSTEKGYYACSTRVCRGLYITDELERKISLMPKELRTKFNEEAKKWAKTQTAQWEFKERLEHIERLKKRIIDGISKNASPEQIAKLKQLLRNETKRVLAVEATRMFFKRLSEEL